MCLEADFFIERDKRLKQFQSAGYIDIEDVFTEGKLSSTDLIIAGLMEYKEIWSTAELYDWKLTPFGKKFMTEKSYQLILVKPGKQEELVKHCLKTGVKHDCSN